MFTHARTKKLSCYCERMRERPHARSQHTSSQLVSRHCNLSSAISTYLCVGYYGIKFKLITCVGIATTPLYGFNPWLVSDHSGVLTRIQSLQLGTWFCMGAHGRRTQAPQHMASPSLGPMRIAGSTAQGQPSPHQWPSGRHVHVLGAHPREPERLELR